MESADGSEDVTNLDRVLLLGSRVKDRPSPGQHCTAEAHVHLGGQDGFTLGFVLRPPSLFMRFISFCVNSGPWPPTSLQQTVDL